MSYLLGKVWGKTQPLVINNVVEFHRIDVKKGGVCSKHKHTHKINAFYVQQGKLLIKVWKNSYDLVDETVLNAGDFTQVDPGEFHQFEALEDTLAYELYWTATLDPNDIQRENVGGVKTMGGKSESFHTQDSSQDYS